MVVSWSNCSRIVVVTTALFSQYLCCVLPKASSEWNEVIAVEFVCLCIYLRCTKLKKKQSSRDHCTVYSIITSDGAIGLNFLGRFLSL